MAVFILPKYEHIPQFIKYPKEQWGWRGIVYVGNWGYEYLPENISVAASREIIINNTGGSAVPAVLYSGKAIYFNGVDQYVDIELPYHLGVEETVIPILQDETWTTSDGTTTVTVTNQDDGSVIIDVKDTRTDGGYLWFQRINTSTDKIDTYFVSTIEYEVLRNNSGTTDTTWTAWRARNDDISKLVVDLTTAINTVVTKTILAESDSLTLYAKFGAFSKIYPSDDYSYKVHSISSKEVISDVKAVVYFDATTNLFVKDMVKGPFYRLDKSFNTFVGFDTDITQEDLDAMNASPRLIYDVWFNNAVLPSGLTKANILSFIPAINGTITDLAQNATFTIVNYTDACVTNLVNIPYGIQTFQLKINTDGVYDVRPTNELQSEGYIQVGNTQYTYGSCFTKLAGQSEDTLEFTKCDVGIVIITN